LVSACAWDFCDSVTVAAHLAGVHGVRGTALKKVHSSEDMFTGARNATPHACISGIPDARKPNDATPGATSPAFLQSSALAFSFAITLKNKRIAQPPTRANDIDRQECETYDTENVVARRAENCSRNVANRFGTR
jgi:hypothetical protein